MQRLTVMCIDNFKSKLLIKRDRCLDVFHVNHWGCVGYFWFHRRSILPLPPGNSPGAGRNRRLAATHPGIDIGIYPGMAHPERDDDSKLEGLRRANRDDEQHWRDKGWEKIEGGRNSSLPQEPGHEDHPVIGADLTRSPFDPSLARDENGNLRNDRADVLRGYGEPTPERNYPGAYNRDELINTDLNPMMEYPRRTNATFRILAIVFGLVVFLAVVALMYWRWLPPVRRSPEGPNGKVQQQQIHNTAALTQFASFVSRMNERR
jgi:hypothetical protein